MRRILVPRRFGARLIALVVVGMAGLITAGALVAVGGADAKSGDVLASFTTSGTFSWTVPSGVEQVTFDVFGAAGGGGPGAQGVPVTDPGGLGGSTTATFQVMTGQVFQIRVGGKGSTFCPAFINGACDDEVEGGFNGGGNGNFAGSGGGSSDVRTGYCALAQACGFDDRIIVAGGGGGGGKGNNTICAGGSGGGVLGGKGGCQLGGGGGTQSEGGDGPGTGENGTFGTGGTAAPLGEGDAGGGGGGGWYGGGGGTTAGGNTGGGGGGSGHVVPSALWPMTTSTGVQSGDGKIVVIAAK